MKHAAFFSSAMVASMLLAVPAGAAAARSVAVHYGELDLAKPQGRGILMTRLHTAAQTICGATPTAMSTTSYTTAYRACEDDAVSRAVASLPDEVRFALATASTRSAAR